MIIKNKVFIILTSLIIVGGLSISAYALHNKSNENQTLPILEENKEKELNDTDEIKQENEKKQSDYLWDGIYSNSNNKYTIIKFEGYAFMYSSNEFGVRILEEKNSELLSFRNDMTLKHNDNTIIIDSKTNKYNHYVGTYEKEEFKNVWSGDYELNEYRIRLRQISNDKVFFRIINDNAEKEYYEIATINNESLIYEDIIIKKLNNIIELKIISDNKFDFLKEVEGLYEVSK